jgi:DNA-binding transcriptional regulator YiaG
MTAPQFAKALRGFGLTQAASAQFFGVDVRTARRWAHAEVSVPVPVAKLLRVMQYMEVTPGQVDAICRARG